MKNYLKDKFVTTYQEEPEKYFSCGGRFEVLGNHTDHNHGLCIAATCDLAIYAAVKKREDKLVHVLSEGFGNFEVDLNNLEKDDEEVGKPISIVRGIVAYLANEFKYGGLDIYLKSEIPAGIGASSSAAYELIIAEIFNNLYNNGEIPLMTLCKAGQSAERNYFGKRCGLLDQIGVAYGGLVFIDFAQIDNPVVEPLRTAFKDYSFIIVDTGTSHEGLSELYSSIPEDMYKVADHFKQAFLRDVDYEELMKNKDEVIENCGELAFKRAQHFFEEDLRVEKAYQAIKDNKVEVLIKLMNQSRESSTKLLENMCLDGEKKGSPLEACEIILKASKKKAGVKINGGGFAGSVIALVPDEELNDVVKALKEKYGKDSIYKVKVRNEVPSEF